MNPALVLPLSKAELVRVVLRTPPSLSRLKKWKSKL